MASTQINRTIGTATNGKKYTMSFWIKRSAIDVEQSIVGVDSANLIELIKFGSNNQLYWYNRDNAGNASENSSANVFRDTSGWYNFVFAYDSTEAAAADQRRWYVNGELQTWGSATGIQTDAIAGTNFDTKTFYFGREGGGTSFYLNALMSHVHYIDGTIYTASAFGSTNSATGQWEINTSPTVTYGNNGFFILKDSGSVTDESGNANNFTLGNGTLTNTEDCPSDVFCTLNFLNNYYPEATFSNGNLKITTKESAPVMGTIGASSGKYYFEVKVNSLASTYGTIGIVGTQATASTQFITSNADEYMYYSQGSLNYNGGSVSTGYDTYTAGDIIGIGMDLDNNRLFVSKNGTWQNSADPTTSTGAYTITAAASTSLGSYFPAVGYWDDNDSANGTYEVNFGNGYFGTTQISSEGTNASGIGKFEYDVPTGYTALSTKGLNE